jgi:hypothetical protein
MVLKKKTRYNHNKKSHLTKRRLNKNSNRRTRKLNKQSGGGIEIYYKKQGALSFGNISASSSESTDFKQINFDQLYEYPEVKFDKSGRYKLVFYIKEPNETTTTNTRTNTRTRSNRYGPYGSYGSTSSERAYGKYVFDYKHNILLTDKPTIVSSESKIDKDILIKYKNAKKIIIHIKISRIEKNKDVKYTQEYPSGDYYFSLKSKN